MSFDYLKTAATATRLLAQFGRTVTRRAYAAGAYNAATGVSTPTTADTSRIGAVFDYSAQGRKGEQYAGGSLVKAGDLQLLLDPNGAADVSDHYLIGGVEYSVIGVSSVNPAGTVVMYDLHLRQV
jgi:hypothetical protein